MKLYLLKSILKKHLGICIGMILIASFGIGIMSGMTSFNEANKTSFNNYLKDYNYPDIIIKTELSESTVEITSDVELEDYKDILQSYADKNGFKNIEEAVKDYASKNDIYTARQAVTSLIKKLTNNNLETIDVDVIKEISEMSGVEYAASRLLFDTIIIHNDSYLSSRIFVYEKEDFNIQKVWKETSKNNKYKNIGVEYNFAKNNNIEVGDVVDVRIDGIYKKAYVYRIVSCPETLAIRNDGSNVSTADFGFIYISKEDLNEEDYSNLINEISIKTEDIFKPEKIQTNVENKLEELNIGIIDSEIYEGSIVYERIIMNLEPIDLLSLIIPTAFFIIVLVVLYLCFSILVRQCRNNIGILRALGHSTKEIRKAFMILGILMSLISAIVSLVLSVSLIVILDNYFENFFPLPNIPYLFNTKAYILSVLITIVIAEIAIIINCKIIDEFKPIEVITRQISSSYKTPKIINTVFKNFSSLFKFSMTTMMRNKKQVIFTIICIASTIALLFGSLSLKSSFDEIVNETFNKRINYDALIFFDEEPSDEFLNEFSKLDCVEKYELTKYYAKTIKYKESTYDVTINALEKGSQMIRVPGVKEIPDEGIILDKYIAKTLGVKEGDYISIDGNEIVVTKLINLSTNRIQYMSFEQAEVLGDVTYGSLVCDTNDSNALTNYLINCDNYLSSTFTEGVYKSSADLYNSYNFIIVILIMISVAIGMTVVMINVKTNIIERKKEISVMRTLGNSLKKISINFFIQLLIQLVPACLIGFPLGYAITKISLKAIEGPHRSYLFVSDIKEIMIVIFITIIYILISHILSMKTIKKWNLSENIKSNE